MNMDAINSVASSAQREALGRMRARFLTSVAGIGLEVRNPEYVADYTRRCDLAVERLLALQTTDPADPRCGAFRIPHTFESDARQWHFFVACDLARAYACPSSRYHHDPMLLERLTLALAFTCDGIRDDNFKGNWWTWDIAALRELSTTLLLIGESLPDELRSRLDTKLDVLPPVIFRTARGKGIVRGLTEYPGHLRGINSLHVLMNHLLVGLVRQDAQYLDDVAVQVHLSLSVDHERLAGGIQPDWTPYSAWGCLADDGYGAGLMETGARLVYLTDGTPWALPPELRKNVLGLFEHFWRWTIFEGVANPSIVGRSVSSPGVLRDALSAGAALLLLRASPEPGLREKILDFLAEWEHGHPRGPAVPGHEQRLALYADSLFAGVASAERKGRARLTGARFFPYGDYLVVRQPGWSAGLRLCTAKTLTYNAANDHNRRGWYLGEGYLHLVTDGREAGDDITPTLDWDSLPGTTRTPSLKPVPFTPGKTVLAGAATLGESAAAGMMYRLDAGGYPVAGCLQACKSYLFLQGLIALTVSDVEVWGLNGNSLAAAETIWYSAPVREGERVLLDGVAVTAEGDTELAAGPHRVTTPTADIFLANGNGTSLRLETRTGAFRDIGVPTLTFGNEWEATSRIRYVSLRQTHRADDPSGCMILAPGADPKARADLSRPPRILRLDAVAHAVESADGSELAVAAFAPAEIPGRIIVDRPAFVLLHRAGGRISLAIALPALTPSELTASRTVSIELPGVVTAAGSAEEGLALRMTDHQTTVVEMALTGAGTRTVVFVTGETWKTQSERMMT